MAACTIGVPLVLATLTLAGQDADVFGTAESGWVFATSSTVVLGALVWWVAGAARFRTRRARCG